LALHESYLVEHALRICCNVEPPVGMLMLN
jgi:hypothetical protein